MSYSRTEYAKFNILYGYLRKIILIFLEFFCRVVFITTLGEDLLGVNSVFINIIQILSLTELGMTNVVLYSFYKPLAANDKDKLRSLIKFYKKVYQKIALAVFFIGISICPFLEKIINTKVEVNSLYVIFFLFLSNTIFSYFFIYKNAILRADQKGYIVNKIEIPLSVVKFIVQVIVLKIFSSFIIYLLIENMVTFITNYSISKRVDKEYSFLDEQATELVADDKKEITDTIKSSFIYKTASVMLNSTDNIIISMLIGTNVVGYFANYKTIYAGIGSLYTVFFMSLTAGIGNLIETASEEHRLKIFNILLLISSWLGIVFSSCFFSLAKEFVILWIGSGYVLNNSVTLCIAITIFLSCALPPIFIYREAMGLYKKVQYMMLIAAIVNIILSIILGHYLGLFGILFGTILSMMTTYIWYEPVVLYDTCFGVTVREYFFKRIKDLAIYIIVLVSIFMFGNHISGETWLYWILKSLILFILSNAFCYIIYKNTEEFTVISKKIEEYVIKNR